MFGFRFARNNAPRRGSSRLGATICIAALSACFTLLGCAENMSMNSTSPTPVVVPASAQISFCNNSPSGCATGSAFSLASLRDLNINVGFQNVPEGHHSQAVQVSLPDGTLYQAFEQSFVIDSSSSGTVSTTQALPVAGTGIWQHSLTGMWQVTVTLDGQPIASQNVQLTK